MDSLKKEHHKFMTQQRFKSQKHNAFTEENLLWLL